MFRFPLFCFLLLLISCTYAQQIERQVIGSMGMSVTQGSTQVSSTAGEAVIESALSGSFFLTQGFQQADKLADDAGTNNPPGTPQPPIEVSYGIYPSPTQGELFLRFEGSEPAILTAALFDEAGRSVGFAETFEIEGETLRSWDISSLPAGVYLLRLMDQTDNLYQILRVMKE